MFLNLFRKRSNQKYINKILNSKRSKISEKKIRSVGIILSLDEYKDYDKLRITAGKNITPKIYKALRANPNISFAFLERKSPIVPVPQYRSYTTSSPVNPVAFSTSS